MNKKLIVIGLSLFIALSILGCSKNKETIKEESNKNTVKISMEDSLNEVNNKLTKASEYYEMNPDKKSMDESLEYAKSILPDGVKDISKNIKRIKG
ncbi:hypothetical protein [Terrisporobacter vanillatitrophus]|uniref:hypothetical protein n=1 Tax=Terrisporobacter vanillatitrophus TaxID=3058402 RepID=UPI00336823E8